MRQTEREGASFLSTIAASFIFVVLSVISLYFLPPPPFHPPSPPAVIENVPPAIPATQKETETEKKHKIQPETSTKKQQPDQKSKPRSLQQQASDRSGIANEDAFIIDKVNMYERLGHDKFVELSTEFYTRVYDDEQKWFRDIFNGSTKEEAIQNQYEFFIQRMGGPNLYSQRKGHPALIGRHRTFHLTDAGAERWLMHMRAAVAAVNLDEDSASRIMNFLTHTAYFLVAGNEMTRARDAEAKAQT